MNVFFHRVLNRHVWEDVDEYRVKGINLERTGFKGKGVGLEATMERLRSGFKVIHQKCTVCGDRRTLHK